MMGVALVVIVVSAIAASMLSKYMKLPGPSEAAGKETTTAPAERKADGELTYFDFEPIVVNLDERKMARYVRVSVTLAIRKTNFSAVEDRAKKKMPELKSWLNVYFAGCTLEDVRGPRNLNRIRQEIAESFNDQLWHNEKPLIEEVLFKDIAVQ